jgi:hypothetical protein
MSRCVSVAGGMWGLVQVQLLLDLLLLRVASWCLYMTVQRLRMCRMCTIICLRRCWLRGDSSSAAARPDQPAAYP